MVEEVLESMWGPYPCQGLSYLEMDGLENDRPKVFPGDRSFKKKFMHFHKFLSSCTHCLKWFYDAILTGSPHLLGNYFEVPHDMHIARPPVHTLGAGIGLSTSRSHFGERSFHIREKFCLWFDPSDQVTGVELKSPPFLGAWPGH